MDRELFRAVICDLDGVVTATRDLHFRAWKETFDELRERRMEAGSAGFEPFSEDDYERLVDGLPREDGVRAFLEDRGVQLPAGAEHDGLESERGVGDAKNRRFQQLLQHEGPQVFEDAIQQLRAWRAAGLKTAVVSSSRNARRVLEAGGIEPLFDARVDGDDLVRHGLAGKPQPDPFLEAARRVGVEPRAAVVLEDAESGVAAGRAGGFGLVVGVARGGDPAGRLRDAGADRVVSDLRELGDLWRARGRRPAAELPNALERLEALMQELGRRRLIVFLDYDGTLSPIVDDPDRAVPAPGVREAVRALAARTPVAVMSGRDRADVEQKLGVEGLIVAGSHGFDIAGPDLRREHPEAKRHLPALDAAEAALRERVRDVPGAIVERKRYGVAIHYRKVEPARVGEVERAVAAVHDDHPELRRGAGKKVFELQPRIDWHKGRAVRWLLEGVFAAGEGAAPALPLYVGDDLTDEDAFWALPVDGVGVVVGEPEHETAADLRLDDPAAVRAFLERLAERLQ